MRAVWKFVAPLHLGTKQEINMPVGAEMLSVQPHAGSPHIWALVDPDAELEVRVVRIVGTGHQEVDEGWAYLGTAMCEGMVWHLFEEGLA